MSLIKKLRMELEGGLTGGQLVNKLSIFFGKGELH